MTSSSEPRVLRAGQAGSAYAPSTPDLRAGTWTRLGSNSTFGDLVTEDTLSGLAERTRSTAEAQGYAVGWTKGVREARAAEQAARSEQEEQLRLDSERREAEHANALAALRAAATKLEQARAELVHRLEEQSAALAVAVTTEVLGQRAAQQTPAEVVRRALDVLPEGALATVRLSPAVAYHVLDAELPAGVTIAVDATLAQADALVELHDHVLDLRIDRAVARVREALR